MRIGLGLVRCSLAKLGMIISLRPNIRLILMGQKRLRGSRLQMSGRPGNGSTVSTNVCGMQVILFIQVSLHVDRTKVCSHHHPFPGIATSSLPIIWDMILYFITHFHS